MKLVTCLSRQQIVNILECRMYIRFKVFSKLLEKNIPQRIFLNPCTVTCKLLFTKISLFSKAIASTGLQYLQSKPIGSRIQMESLGMQCIEHGCKLFVKLRRT